MSFRSKFFVSQYLKISLGKTSVYRKISGIEKFYASERGVSRCSVKHFCHTVPKKSLGNHSVFHKISDRNKIFMDKRGGGITIFRRKLLVSQCRKIWWASLQCFRKFGVSKNFMHNKGVSQFSVENFFVSQCRKFS